MSDNTKRNGWKRYAEGDNYRDNALQKGWLAYCDGKRAGANPYENRLDTAWLWWQRGFALAQRDLGGSK